MDLLRFKPLPPLARVRLGVAVLGIQKLAGPGALRGRHSPRVDRALDGPRGLGRGLGPDAARQVRRPRRRHLDGLALGQAAPAPPVQGEESARSCSATRAASWQPLFAALQTSIEARGRARADRPPGPPARERATASRSRRAQQTRSAAGHDPRGFRGRREHYDRVVATVPGTSSRSCSTPGWPRRWGRTTSASCDHRVLRGALPAARAGPPVPALVLDQRRRPRHPLRRPDRAHEPDQARALRRPPLPLRRQLPRRRARAPGLEAGRAARPLQAGLRKVNPAFCATG